LRKSIIRKAFCISFVADCILSWKKDIGKKVAYYECVMHLDKLNFVKLGYRSLIGLLKLIFNPATAKAD
jgi:hypothetical protein